MYFKIKVVSLKLENESIMKAFFKFRFNSDLDEGEKCRMGGGVRVSLLLGQTANCVLKLGVVGR